MKKVVANFLKVGISFGLLAYLIFQADVGKIVSMLQETDYGYVGLGLLIFLLALFLFTYRWQLLLRKINIDPGFSRLLVFYFIGYFFNNFLPTTIGGDVSRAYYVARSSGNRAGSLGTILLERILGVLATLTLAALALLWAMSYFRTSRIIFITVLLIAGVLFVLLTLLNVAMFNRVAGILKRVSVLNAGERINKVLAIIHHYRNARGTVLSVFLLSLGCQFLLILMNYSLALALGLAEITLAYLMLVVPVTFVMGLIPSINGLGVRETGYVVLLARVGVTTAEALSLSFLNLIVPMALSSIGGILLLFYRNSLPGKPLSDTNIKI